MRNLTKQSGHTLIEMMIALTLAMLISISALYLYSGQIRTFYHHARKQQTTQEVQAAFEVITSLLRQAEMCLICTPAQQIAITYPGGVANPNPNTALYQGNDSISLDFTVPGGYAIWPNTATPYANNTIHLTWSQTNGTIQLASAANIASAQTAATVTIAGSIGNMNTRIINFDVWPLTAGGPGANASDKPTAGYHVVMTARVGTQDMTYTNPLDANGSMKNYRTVTYEADVLPRNW